MYKEYSFDISSWILHTRIYKENSLNVFIGMLQAGVFDK